MPHGRSEKYADEKARIERNTDRLSGACLRTLAAVMWLRAHGGLVRYREIRRATGLAHNAVHRHLCRLRAAGLVRFEEGLTGTLHPSCEVRLL